MKSFSYALAVIVLFLVGCRKDRTCVCSITSTGFTTTRTQTPGIPPLLAESDTTIVSPLNSLSTSNTKYNKVSKHDMRSNCRESSSETFHESSVNQVPGIFTITTSQSGIKSYSCKID